MPRRPHTHLFVDPRRTVVLSGPHIHVLDALGLRSITRDASLGPIRCAATSSDARHLATVGDDKRLDLWDLESLALLSTRELPKKPTSVAFSRGSDVLVSDKFGDVFRYAFHPDPEPAKEKTPDTLASHDNPSGGELILGHASLVTTCLLTPDQKYIITADRDEHIRVSWYPEGYVIQSYCLGHKKYVSAIHIPSTSPAVLISGGGDVELKIWDWMTGRLRQNITIFPTVEPFIRVTAQNRRRERRDDVEPAGKEDDSPVPEEEGSTAKSDVVLVVRRISSFVSGSETHVVFSAIGATAIFEFVLTESPDRPHVRHHDFKKPVIDFTVCEQGTVWVLLDADFPDDSDSRDDVPSRLVQVVQWSVDKFVDAGNSELLIALDAVRSSPATADELRALDLYSDLSSLPKSIGREQGSDATLEHSKATHEPRDEERPAGEGTSGLTKRALGRLKHKRALDQLQSDRVDVPGPDGK